MAVLLFRLANVPDDEAEDVRELLREHDIYFYETEAGRWRVGLDAIWLPDSTHEAEARALLADYQRARTEQQRLAYAELDERGEVPGVAQKIFAHPVRSLALILAIAFILALSILPFWLS